MENTSREYQQIHPKGYVPALVHNGQLVTESNDIIDFISKTLSGASNDVASESLKPWLTLSDENQDALKLLTYEILFKPKGHYSDPKDVEYYLDNQKNPELRQFVLDFSSGFSKERVQKTFDEVYRYLEFLDNTLSSNEYLAGSLFSDADIANVVNVHRYSVCKIDLEKYTHLYKWYLTIKERPAFKVAIDNWMAKVK